MTVEIPGWHPAYNLNGRGHWSKQYREKKDDARVAFICARTAGWERLDGRVRLTVTLRYPGGVLPDPDNLAGRCKGLIDGLKEHFMEDDSPKFLDLEVKAERGPKATVMVLEPSTSAYIRGEIAK